MAIAYRYNLQLVVKHVAFQHPVQRSLVIDVASEYLGDIHIFYGLRIEVVYAEHVFQAEMHVEDCL